MSWSTLPTATTSTSRTITTTSSIAPTSSSANPVPVESEGARPSSIILSHLAQQQQLHQELPLQTHWSAGVQSAASSPFVSSSTSSISTFNGAEIIQNIGDEYNWDHIGLSSLTDHERECPTRKAASKIMNLCPLEQIETIRTLLLDQQKLESSNIPSVPVSVHSEDHAVLTEKVKKYKKDLLKAETKFETLSRKYQKRGAAILAEQQHSKALARELTTAKKTHIKALAVEKKRSNLLTREAISLGKAAKKLNMRCRERAAAEARNRSSKGNSQYKLGENCLGEVLGSKLCQHDGCVKHAGYNYFGSLGRRFCAQHKLEGMVDEKSLMPYINLCENTECWKFANYNFKGEVGHRFCRIHKLEGMWNSRDKDHKKRRRLKASAASSSCKSSSSSCTSANDIEGGDDDHNGDIDVNENDENGDVEDSDDDDCDAEGDSNTFLSSSFSTQPGASVSTTPGEGSDKYQSKHCQYQPEEEQQEGGQPVPLINKKRKAENMN